MRISKLFCGIGGQFFGCESIKVTGLSHNSKTVKNGDLYFALRDNTFTEEAFNNGAAAAVTSKRAEGYPCAVVRDVRLAMALAAKRFYNAADKMKIFGVVGTNGKTTTTYILKHILECGTGRKVGLIGTTGIVGAGAGGSNLTTPDPIDLHRILAEMYRNKIRTAVMEVSAHAIHYRKVAGIKWRGVVYTNITPEHLDFFQSFEEYKNTKISFFGTADIKAVAVNADDEFAAEIFSVLNRKTAAVTYSAENKDIVLFGGGSNFTLNGTRVHIPLCGRFNVYNTLGAVAIAQRCGVKRKEIAEALPTIPQVPGRFNTYTVNGITVIIDYAHTPDGLKKILTAARELLPEGGELISVFGCGGDRDRSKRGIMGQISAELADRTVLTGDNPRKENPDEIIAEIERGITTRNISAVVDNILGAAQKYVKITDRTEAIEYALNTAKYGDIVVVAGKGHEDYIDINGKKIPYSDAAVIKNWHNTHTITAGEN
jgi:UDP-N-acetylmuramoyl-L-alanyl-D-glutamate--2,6-diaminopimelate ligase